MGYRICQDCKQCEYIYHLGKSHRSMGADGGTLIKRHEIAPENTEKQQQSRTVEDCANQWTHCALSGEKLHDPVVSDARGNIYNKTSILKYLLGESSHDLPPNSEIKQLRDLVELHREIESGKWVEPMTGKDIEREGSSVEFAYLAECGHISTWEILRSSSSCPTCATSYTTPIVLNPRRAEATTHNSERIKELKEQNLSHSLRPTKRQASRKRRAASSPEPESAKLQKS